MSAQLGDREAPLAAGKRSRAGEPLPPNPGLFSPGDCDQAGQKRQASPAHGRPSAKKMKNDSNSDDSSSSNDDDSDDDSESIEEQASAVTANPPLQMKQEVKVTQQPQGVWNEEDVALLLARMTAVLPAEDTAKYSTQVERINWGKVAFKTYSAIACREKWGLVAHKVRKYRTLTELVEDAKCLQANPKVSRSSKAQARSKIESHPDKPKKPLTPYFRFFMEERQKYQELNPSLSTTELSKLLSEKYKELPDDRKQKYVKDFTLDTAEYKKKMDMFKATHAELFPEETNGIDQMKLAMAANPNPAAKKSKAQPPKTTTPQLIFIQCKTKEHLLRDSSASRKHLQDVYRAEYAEMTDEEKMPYIEMAIKAQHQYTREMAEFCRLHPDHKPKGMRAFLSKADQRIKDSVDGKPAKPPPNGYGLFTMYLLPKLTDVPNMERMAEVSRRWKNLSQEEREDFNQEVVEKNNEYKKLYAEYLAKLTPAERIRVLEEDQGKKVKEKENVPVKKGSNKSAERKKQQPVSAMFLFLEENRGVYKQKYPEMDHQELTRLLAKEFSSLPDDKKAKYKKLEQERRTQIIHDQDDDEEERPPQPDMRKKKKKFPGEPKKPPSSGYGLFSSEQLKSDSMKDIPANQRMSSLPKRWHSLREQDREMYKARRTYLVEQYDKDLQRFKARLSKKDLEEWEESQKSKRKKKVVAVKEPSTADSDSSDSDDDDSDVDDDDDASDSETRPAAKHNGPKKGTSHSQVSDSESSSDDSGSSDSDDSESE